MELMHCFFEYVTSRVARQMYHICVRIRTYIRSYSNHTHIRTMSRHTQTPTHTHSLIRTTVRPRIARHISHIQVVIAVPRDARTMESFGKWRHIHTDRSATHLVWPHMNMPRELTYEVSVFIRAACSGEGAPMQAFRVCATPRLQLPATDVSRHRH